MKEEYEYVKVNMTPEEIAHAMIDGEIFYSHGGGVYFYWNSSSGFIDNKGANITLRGLFYKRIKKERKFNEREWYPCIDKDGDNSIYFYSVGRFFIDEFKRDFGNDISSMKWIGNSLGKIKFGEEHE